MKTLEQLRAIPFFQLSPEEKKQLIKATQDRASSQNGREASIAQMAVDIMKKAR